jgi:branched-chain amino acid transport system substrate-binding protein
MPKKVTEAGSISRRRLLGAAGAGAALAASPFQINLLQAQETTIKIGFPVPLTGPYGTEAQDQVRAGQLAVAQFNDAGGLGGRKAELWCGTTSSIPARPRPGRWNWSKRKR